ncbi:F-type H+-transporting ATPase subunit c [Entomoplasma freundtii]|uniref:ATP synthase subunit c n=1 Tax=Entomoplasma freundtii TaxID=74700 RepID=A0A2K8NVL5_9MOLU|nr:hypothetical protein [Entomoplasma freundtii]ATZ16673.1 F0F1 ATP synthase subunit C [Entomoplasma freundtii]TDY58160.1 F-type H+-transporting ATPase subunit c [Entomoplasma freundtii]
MLMTELINNVYANLFSAFATILPNFLADANDTSTGFGLKMIGAGLAAVGMIGAGLGQGIIGQGACMAIGRNPEVASKITSTMIIGAGIAESGAIYALVIAILIIFVA